MGKITGIKSAQLEISHMSTALLLISPCLCKAAQVWTVSWCPWSTWYQSAVSGQVWSHQRSPACCHLSWSPWPRCWQCLGSARGHLLASCPWHTRQTRPSHPSGMCGGHKRNRHFTPTQGPGAKSKAQAPDGSLQQCFGRVRIGGN